MAPPPEPPSTITLRIKVPPGHIPGGADEFRLGDDIPVNLKIGQVRERIQEAIPSSPTPERQRLLYGGRALVDNDQTLADALNTKRDRTQNEYVVHLLVKGDGTNSAPVPHLRAQTPTRSASPATNQAPQQPGQPQIPIPQQQQQQHQPHHHHNNSLEQLQAQAFAQQQHIHQQLLQNMNQQRFGGPHGMMPFGMQQMGFAGHMPQGMPHGMQTMPTPGAPQGTQPQPQPAPTPTVTSPAPGQTPAQPPQAGSQPATEQSQPQTNGQQAQQPPRRPISNQGFHMEGVGPNGQRITIHQQTVNIPHLGLQGQHVTGQQMPHVPHMPSPFGLPPLQALPFQNPNHAPRPAGPSLIDRARENIAEMRRMIDELRASTATTEQQQQRITELETRTLALNDYIDPLHLGNIGNNRPRTGMPPGTQTQPPGSTTSIGEPGWQQRARQMRQAQQQSGNTRSSDVTCYLLSSPNGPHAILYSPQHGTYTGSLPYHTQIRPTLTAAGQGDAANPAGNGHGQPVQIVGQDQPLIAQQAPQQAAAAQQDPLAGVAMGAMFNHMWLLLRILIFAYFLLGANLGWRRPLALAAIGIGFWLIRTGLLGDGGAVRRWWEGIMADGRPAAQDQQNGQAGGQEQQQEGQAAAAGNAGAARMPTPEQVAQRLLDEDARIRNERVQRFRDRIRPVERAVALLVASLWPGVGEQFVRAREQEERRRAEEEVAARRREEEERQQREEEAKKQSEGNAEEGTKEAVDTNGTQPTASMTDAQAAAAPSATDEKTGSG